MIKKNIFPILLLVAVSLTSRAAELSAELNTPIGQIGVGINIEDICLRLQKFGNHEALQASGCLTFSKNKDNKDKCSIVPEPSIDSYTSKLYKNNQLIKVFRRDGYIASMLSFVRLASAQHKCVFKCSMRVVEDYLLDSYCDSYSYRDARILIDDNIVFRKRSRYECIDNPGIGLSYIRSAYGQTDYKEAVINELNILVASGVCEL